MPKESISENQKSKLELRRELADKRKSVANADALSRLVTQKALPLLHGSVMVYVSIGSELDTYGLIEMLMRTDGVTVFAPYTVNGNIRARRVACLKPADKYGNMPNECYLPSEPDGNCRSGAIKLDYCVTPLLGFNRDGYRIGYGKGCYDRFFADNDVYKLGVAYDCQSTDFEPDPHDVPLDCCITEKKVIYF